MAQEFLDCTILVYAFTHDRRAATARELLARGCVINVQGLNEFATVARRTLHMTWGEMRAALGTIRTLCPRIVAIDIDTHAAGLDIAERHGLAIIDALTIASALRAGCETVWSEEMQHGMMIEGRLRIANPFRDG